MASEEEPVKMTAHEDNSVIMEGYLDKRGKMKLVSTWKRYWFVLKGQLLLYYKSQLECDNLSACRGSLNMGIASCVRPGAHRGPPTNGTQGYTIEVVTRSQVITLRTKDRSLQEQWLKALLDSMALPISTPLRNSTGPMHFRYSLDNLPVIEEAETENRKREKQSTLPIRNSVARHDSVLGRIKRIGGTSYGGSLDTFLKRRPNNQTQQHSPQQPKIPRIKAVDRMLEMQSSNNAEENSLERKGEKENSPVPERNCQLKKERNDQCINNASADNISCLTIEKQTDCCERISVKHSDSTTSIRSDSEVKERVSKLSEVSEDEYSKKNESQFSIDKIQDLNIKSKEVNVTFTKIENEKHAINVENKARIVIENKLHQKSIKSGNDISTTKESTQQKNQCVTLDSKKEVKDTEYDSEEELNNYSQNHNLTSDDKTYEEVKASEHEMHKDDNREDIEEEEYYSQYDKFSMIKSLSDVEHEPDLPPRPSVSSKSSNEFMKSHKKEIEDGEYSSYYETSLNTTTSPIQVVSSGGEASPSVKKKTKLHTRIKLKKKKSPSKESVASEEGSSNTGNKKKRKMSFLKRMLKHYRKKPESQVNSDNPGDSDEPEYETVDYSAALEEQRKSTEKEESHLDPEEISTEKSVSPEKDLHKEKLFGTSLLSDQAMQELKMKLRVRDDSISSDIASPTTFLEDNEGYEHISLDEVPDKKPVPTPRSGKQKSDNSEQTGMFNATRYRCNDSIDRANKPPKLPPRKVARPRSPWHDIPKNNSPIYGNFQDLGIAVDQKSEEKVREVPHKESAPQAGEWDQEIEDELLGTPQGFVYIQNKWKAVEKSNELIQKGKSPPKNRFSVDNKMKHNRTSSNGSIDKSSIKSDSSDTEHKNIVSTSAELYSDVQKLSAKTIIKNLNFKSEGSAERLSGVQRNGELCDSVDMDNKEPVKVLNTVPTSEKVESENINLHDSLLTTDTVVTLRRPHGDRISINTKVLCCKTEVNHNGLLNISNPSSQTKDVNDINNSDLSMKTDQVLFHNSTQPTRVTDNIAKTFCGNEDEEGEQYDIMPRLNRHSDELNLLLAQLAEITSAPLLPQGAATSLVDIPDGRKSKPLPQKVVQPSPTQPEEFVLGPIRRRRHSDPDYDVPRPHGSLLHLLASNRMSTRSNQSQSGHESDVIEATHFFGEADLISSSGRSSLSLRHSVISEVADDQSDTSYYVSMAPDSLEVPQVKDMEGTI